MDTARYIVTYLIVITFPPVLAFWLVLHPAIGFWRRLGPTRTYVIMIPAMLLGVFAMTRVTDVLLAVEFGTNYLLWPLVVLFYGISVRIELRCRRKLKPKTLVGVPELAPPEGGGTLLEDGIYGTVRHPRYVGVLFSVQALAFFANYLALYLFVPVLIAVVYAIVVLEERELRDRFGDEYVQYAVRVPRFIPRRSRQSGGAREAASNP